MKNFSYKSCRKSSKAPDEDLQIDLDRNLDSRQNNVSVRRISRRFDCRGPKYGIPFETF